jgi:signal transduction histidine kinase
MNALAQVRPKKSGPIDPLVLGAAFEACPEALAVVDRGRVVHANAAFARAFSPAGRSQLVGKTLAELGPDADRAPRSCMQTSTGRFSAKGRDFLVVSARPMLPSMSAAELRRSKKLEAVGRLVGGVAHDFNNLLTGVVLCCDLLLAKLEKNSPLRRYAEEMKIADAQGSTLIRQLLAVVREDRAEPPLLSWNEVVKGMRGLLARLIGENIELATDLASGLHRVRMDAAEAQQIVLNLVLNARDAMPDGGRILLATRNCPPPRAEDSAEKLSSSGWIEFEVSDTGCGMDEDVRAAMFQPFFTTKEADQGSGLGLATVKGIVDQYGGSIEVASEPEKGTQIRIGFPAAQTGAAYSSPLQKGNMV